MASPTLFAPLTFCVIHQCIWVDNPIQLSFLLHFAIFLMRTLGCNIRISRFLRNTEKISPAFLASSTIARDIRFYNSDLLPFYYIAHLCSGNPYSALCREPAHASGEKTICLILLSSRSSHLFSCHVIKRRRTFLFPLR